VHKRLNVAQTNDEELSLEPGVTLLSDSKHRRRHVEDKRGLRGNTLDVILCRLTLKRLEVALNRLLEVRD